MRKAGTRARESVRLPPTAIESFCTFLQRAHDVLRRRGHYWFEKRERENRDRFFAETAAIPPGPGFEKALAEARDRFLSEREAIERDREREFVDWQNRRSRKAAERRRRKASRWREWAHAFAEAVRKGLPRPAAPGRNGPPVRRLCRQSLNPPPSAEALLDALAAARGHGRVEEKIRLGSMLLDLEATLDSSLRRDAWGEITGRNPGLKGWLAEHSAELSRHYAALMQYRRLAQELREAELVSDPVPAAWLLGVPSYAPRAFRERLAPNVRRVKANLKAGAGRTMKDLRAALVRREWRRTG